MKQENFEMKTVGKGELVIAVTACIHGNEPVGKHVHDWLLEIGDSLDAEVRLIFGNPEASLSGVRFIDENLNRVFPGSPNGNYEERQAHRIMQEINGADLHIDFHSTTNPINPFAICMGGKDDNDLVKATGLENVMIYAAPDSGNGYAGKTLNQAMDCHSIAVECGQHSQKSTIDTGIAIMQNVLKDYNLLPGKPKHVEQSYFLLDKPLVETEKDMQIEPGIKDFRKVPTRAVVARGKEGALHATETFYPILVDRDPAVRENGVLMLKSQKVSYSHGKVTGRLN